MRVSINQPCYLGWLGYFDRIRRSDLHIVLDHVQFEKGSYTNRCRIKQRDGREMWLTVPVEKGKPINETKIVGAWWVKHRKALEQAYGLWLDTPIDVSLNAVLADTTEQLCSALGLKPSRVTSTGLGGEDMGRKSDLVLNLCQNVGATQYISGPQGRNYLDIPAFERAGIEVLYHDYPSDGDHGLSAVHHLFTGDVQWAKTSLDYSQPSAEAEPLGQDPEDRHPRRHQDPEDQTSEAAGQISAPSSAGVVPIRVGPGTTQ